MDDVFMEEIDRDLFEHGEPESVYIRLAKADQRNRELEAALSAVREELRRRHCYPLVGQSTAEAVRMAFDNGDSHLEGVRARAEKAEAEAAALKTGDLHEAYAAGEQKIIGLLAVANDRIKRLKAHIEHIEGSD